MPRLARAADDTRTRLLRAGQAIARKSGLRAVTVRGVTARAQANLGSFVHHFGTREAFLDEMVEGWYAPLLARLQLTLDDTAPVEQRLRGFCVALVQFLVANRGFVTHMLLDAAAGEKPAQHFVRQMPQRHPALLLQLIAQAQAHGVVRKEEEPVNVMLFLLASLALPVVTITAVGWARLLPSGFEQALQHHVLESAQWERRLDWALAALRPGALGA